MLLLRAGFLWGRAFDCGGTGDARKAVQARCSGTGNQPTTTRISRATRLRSGSSHLQAPHRLALEEPAGCCTVPCVSIPGCVARRVRPTTWVRAHEAGVGMG